jgi:hypothetical protein
LKNSFTKLFGCFILLIALTACSDGVKTLESISSIGKAPVAEAAKPVTTPAPTSTQTPAPSPEGTLASIPLPKETLTPKKELDKKYDYQLIFPTSKYPKTAAHIIAAIKNGETPVCTIDRTGADDNRKESLRGIATKKGYDRDEFPMAMCAEGGKGANIAYVPYADNRGSGSWVGNQLEEYPNGTRILFIVKDDAYKDIIPAVQEPISKDRPEPTKSAKPVTETSGVSYQNCTAVRKAGAAPIHRDDPGYSKNLDRDGDGIACE